MLLRLKQMLIKEFLQALRDPRMRIVIFIVPIVQMTVFAFALTTDVTRISTAVLDLDNTPASRELLSTFTASGYFEITEVLLSQREIDAVMDEGRERALIHIPAGFAQDLAAGTTARVQVLADGTDSNSASIIFGYATNVLNGYILRTPAAGQGAVEIETRAWYNPNLESKYYFVPGLIAVMVLVISMILTCVAIVREKEIGTIEQVMVTPITSLEFILGKTIPYAVISYIVMTLMLGIAMLVFGIRVEGSWLLLYALTGIYIVGNLGLALFISVTAETQQQAVLTVFLFMMPLVLLSGFMFPVHNMPVVVQYFDVLNPMRWFIEVVRGVVIKGVGVDVLWPAILMQAVLATAFILLAASRFKKTLA